MNKWNEFTLTSGKKMMVNLDRLSCFMQCQPGEESEDKDRDRSSSDRGGSDRGETWLVFDADEFAVKESYAEIKAIVEQTDG